MSSLEPHEKILAYRIRTLSRAIGGMATEMANDKLKLPLPEVQVIAALGALGPTGVMEVSRYAEQDKSQTSRVIESLITKGLAQKKDKPKTNDGRTTFISLTATGRAVLRKVPRVESLLESRIFHSLSEKELTQLAKTIDKVLKSYSEDPDQ